MVSRSDRVQRDLERAARRARRLAERAGQRAARRADKARMVAERAERLAARASRRTTSYAQDFDRSVEDLVDKVTDRWSRKAEEWIDSASELMTDDLRDDVDRDGSSGRKARQAERRARRNGEAKSAGDYDQDHRHDQGYRYSRFRRRSKRIRARYRNKYGHGLYRNPDDRKVCGVCSGFADYFRVDTWKVRCGAVLGLVFIPQITITGYFIAYFLMDKKPYYRRVADKYQRTERTAGTYEERFSVNNENNDKTKGQEPRMSNAQVLRQAKRKFSDIENRLRDMESHVTSSTFELQRELKKISGDSPSA